MGLEPSEGSVKTHTGLHTLAEPHSKRGADLSTVVHQDRASPFASHFSLQTRVSKGTSAVRISFASFSRREIAVR